MATKRPKKSAAGLPGVTHGLSKAITQMGVRRTALTLLKVNQVQGFDCPGCAWPEPGADKRSHFEFCENGAKAVAEEATLRRVTPEFFAQHSVTELNQQTDYWLGQQGRLTSPMIKRPGSVHYVPVDWAEAFAVTARHLNAIQPDQALFYTSGRTSNEAAFLYQMFARAYGTNNLPDCSNMCHESSGVALNATIGVGKGTVTLDDIHHARLIVIAGQNPGTNHPRMLAALETAKRNGARIISINPLPEAGLMRFKNPQKVSGILGRGTDLSDLHLPIRVGGDLALFQAIGAHLLAWNAVDQSFVDTHTAGFADYAASHAALAAHLRAISPGHVAAPAPTPSAPDLPGAVEPAAEGGADGQEIAARIVAATGLTAESIEAAARMFADSDATIVCWAMGLTQGRDAVATIQEIVNVQLLRGMVGKPGAGLCPVRGHSNVQGDRTMGIYHEVPPWAVKMPVDVPERRGYDTVESIRAMRDGHAKVFVGMGGNFAAATPDTEVTENAMRKLDLAVHISTKLNRSHAIVSQEQTALILPCLGRTEADPAGVVTVEDSMSTVHTSRGKLKPASAELKSEAAIVCELAKATLNLDWQSYQDDYRTVRALIAQVVPGFEDFESRVQGDGFTLAQGPRDSRTFPTASGKAVFTSSPLTTVSVPEGRLLLQTLRSHDQYNTTIYGLDDRYRGIKGERRVIFVSPADLERHGIQDGEVIDIVSEWPDRERKAEAFRAVAYPTVEGCAAAYFPEANVLVPLDSTAHGSNTPVSKQIIIRLVKR
ncbi:molybdopterin-dependent oxidoreductase [Catelliglobosispora koreensis]|uniref:molybdopterin-dependent oxidoreductase n=1 Tax=Catelliglobosispora koreensis TaxID=129052 RepID=UPI00039AADBF|nr:molybdopterin-dependent oxidoreductase [Catelliglobosispora koreensis]